MNWSTASLWNSGVVVQESTLPGAGMGLFADQAFAPNDIITEYIGEVITMKKSVKLTHKNAFHYVAQVDP